MQTEAQSLESVLHAVVREAYETKLGRKDQEITNYLVRLLCEFSAPGNLYQLWNEHGEPIEDLSGMQRAADPVFGSAASFDAERRARKYIGDYALFATGMCHEILKPKSDDENAGPTITQLVAVGKESYFIVSQFNVFEYEKEAPFFGRLAREFEHCVLSLAMVREEMSKQLKLHASKQ